jgi:hypothetical protein
LILRNGVLANIFDSYLAAQVASNRMLDIAEDPVMAAALRAVISTFGTALTQHGAFTNEHQASLREAAQEITAAEAAMYTGNPDETQSAIMRAFGKVNAAVGLLGQGGGSNPA